MPVQRYCLLTFYDLDQLTMMDSTTELTEMKQGTISPNLSYLYYLCIRNVYGTVCVKWPRHEGIHFVIFILQV